MTRQNWTLAEDTLVREMTAAGFAAFEIAALLDRTYSAVRTKRAAIDPPHLQVNTRRWSETEDHLVAELCQFMPDQELGHLLGRTMKATRERRRKLVGIRRFTWSTWTESEVATLRAAYPAMPRSAMAVLLPRHPIGAIMKKANDLGLAKSPQFLAQHRGGRYLLPPEYREVMQLAKTLRKEIKNEERRRSASDVVCGTGGAERQAGSG